MADVATEPKQTETEPEKPKAAPRAPHSCLCGSYEMVDTKDADVIFSTGCDQTTYSTFAQGHDARLVSFLVEGYFDGYQLRQVVAAGKPRIFATPAEAVADVSNALQSKAEKATANRQEKLDAQAARQAERDRIKAEKVAAKEKAKADKADKAAEPKAAGAEVVAGSQTGDLPELAEGQARIKGGRWEYVADIDAEGVATYTDGSGEVQTRERDAYQLLGS